LRQAADPAEPPRRRRPRRRVLRYRAAAGRHELLETAALLEHADSPDPGAVLAARELLRDRASPLYDAAVDAAELRAALEDLRAALGQPRSTTNEPRDPA
jgi:hypothetical protein